MKRTYSNITDVLTGVALVRYCCCWWMRSSIALGSKRCTNWFSGLHRNQKI